MYYNTKKITGIYKITSPTGRVYIGQSIHIYKRWYSYKKLHCKGQPVLYRSLKKHRPENHTFEIIHKCKKNELIPLENFYIDLYGCLDSDIGMNGKFGKEQIEIRNRKKTST